MPLSGPSGQMTGEAAQAQNFSTLLQGYAQQNFAGLEGALSNLSNINNPILEAGPGQQGFTPTELAARNSAAINANSANYRNAAVVAGENAAAHGGATFAPTGGQQQVQGEIAAAGAQQLSGMENQIQEENYATGRENFLNAEKTGLEIASEYNPNATAGAATGEGAQAYSEANTNNQASQAWEGQLGGLIGGLGGAALGNPGLVHT
jgi:hypothetical protein